MDVNVEEITLDAEDIFRTLSDMGIDTSKNDCIEMVIEADVDNNGSLTFQELQATISTGAWLLAYQRRTLL